MPRLARGALEASVQAGACTWRKWRARERSKPARGLCSPPRQLASGNVLSGGPGLPQAYHQRPPRRLDQALAPLQALTRLTRLEIESTQFPAGAALFGQLAALAALSELRMASTKTAANLTFLHRLSGLTRLRLQGFVIGKALGRLKHLRHLVLMLCMGVRSPGVLRVVAGLTELCELQLSQKSMSGVRNEELACLARLSALSRLVLGSEIFEALSVRSLDVACVTFLTGLRQLDLSSSLINSPALSGPGLAKLAALSGLRALPLRFEQVHDSCLARLGALLVDLIRLVLDYFAVTEKGLTGLDGIRKVRELELLGCTLGGEGVARLGALVMSKIKWL